MIRKKSAVLAVLLVPCLIVDPAFAAGEHTDFIVQALAPRPLNTGRHPPQTQARYWPIVRSLLTDKTIRARLHFSADQIEEQLRGELENFYAWKRNQWTKQLAPAEDVEEALRARIDALWALLILKRQWAPPPPLPSERLQNELNDELKKAPLELSVENEKDATTLQFIQVVPKMLAAYARTIAKGFRAVGRGATEETRVAPKEETAYAQFVKDLWNTVAHVSMLHIHGAPDEKEIMSIKLPGLNVVLVHRIVEYLVRYGWGGIQFLRENADVIVLSYQHELPLYRILFPKKRVVSIPLGFDEPKDFDESRLQREIIAVGSNTAWGEMRRLEDLIKLKKAVEAEVEAKKPEKEFLWYAGEDLTKVDVNSYVDRGDAVVVTNQEILAQKDFKDESAFRAWLLDRAKGLLILRLENFTPDDVAPHSLSSRLAKWESNMIDFDTQIYRTKINRDRLSEDSGGRLHRSVGNSLFVVSESPAMIAIEQEEGLNAVYIPHLGKGKLDYREGARRIINLVNNTKLRRQMIESNIATARTRVNMKAIARAHMFLARKLLASAA